MLGKENQIVGDPAECFFEQNPKMKYYPIIKQLVREVGKDEASKILWAVHLIEDPQSPYRTMPYEERVMLVNEEYLEEPEFNWLKYDELIATYPSIAMTKKQRRFKTLDDALDAAIRSLTTTNDSKEASTILSKIKSMYETVRIAEKEAEKELEKIEQIRGEQQPGIYNQ